MFNKKSDEQESRSATAPSIEQPETVEEIRKQKISVIGPTLRFKGELSANEDLVIEGHIEGKISHQDKNLTIGNGGMVKADIHAKIVDIQGNVDGDVRGDEIVHLRKTAVVNGNIHAPRVTMEDGAMFTGSVEMTTRDAKPEKAEEPRSTPSLSTVSTADSAVHATGDGG